MAGLSERKLYLDSRSKKGKQPINLMQPENFDLSISRTEVVDKNLGDDRDKSLRRKSYQKDSKVILYWEYFQWKPHASRFLNGPGNWNSYSEVLLIQLEIIGNKPRINLTILDERNLAAAILRTVTVDTENLIFGMKEALT